MREKQIYLPPQCASSLKSWVGEMRHRHSHFAKRLTDMEYEYPPTYNTQGWEESLSLMSQGQFASTDVDAGNFPAGHPLLAANYPAQQTMAQHLYEPMVCSLFLQSISMALTDHCA